MQDTAQILVNLYNGERLPLGNDVSWLARLSDGRPLSSRQSHSFDGLKGPSKLFTVPFFDNFFDDYTVLVSAHRYDDSGWFPVRVHPNSVATLDILTLPKEGTPHFANATWARLLATRPDIAAIIQRGCEDGQSAERKYGIVLENRPKSLACFLNLATAMADMRLPSGKKIFDYYWNVAWPLGDGDDAGWPGRLDQVFKQDRFFCYVEESILPDIQAGAKSGTFAPEANPGLLHPDATESYKQTQFDVGNVQLTFHGRDTHALTRPDGTAVSCIKIEPDMDYYKDLLTHGLLEVLPNWLSRHSTEPTVAFALRWMAGKRAGLPSFNPLYTVEA